MDVHKNPRLTPRSQPTRCVPWEHGQRPKAAAAPLGLCARPRASASRAGARQARPGSRPLVAAAPRAGRHRRRDARAWTCGGSAGRQAIAGELDVSPATDSRIVKRLGSAGCVTWTGRASAALRAGAARAIHHIRLALRAVAPLPPLRHSRRASLGFVLCASTTLRSWPSPDLADEKRRAPPFLERRPLPRLGVEVARVMVRSLPLEASHAARPRPQAHRHQASRDAASASSALRDGLRSATR